MQLFNPVARSEALVVLISTGVETPRLKQTISTVEMSQQRADQLEVLSKPKLQRLRRRQLYNDQSDSRCWAKQRKKDWNWDKSRMSRVTRSVEQHKAGKIETETRLQRAERFEVLSKQKQIVKDWDADKSTTSRTTRGPKQTKAT